LKKRGSYETVTCLRACACQFFENNFLKTRIANWYLPVKYEKFIYEFIIFATVSDFFSQSIFFTESYIIHNAINNKIIPINGFFFYYQKGLLVESILTALPFVQLFRINNLLYTETNWTQVGSGHQPPHPRITQKNSSKWSWLHLYVNKYFIWEPSGLTYVS